jgi:hypothetical protein
MAVRLMKTKKKAAEGNQHIATIRSCISMPWELKNSIFARAGYYWKALLRVVVKNLM